MVETALVPLPTKRLNAVKFAAPVPPRATGRIPEVIWFASNAMVEVATAVIKPLPLTVKVTAVEESPKLPMFELTVARLKVPLLLSVASPPKVTKPGVEEAVPTKSCPEAGALVWFIAPVPLP